MLKTSITVHQAESTTHTDGRGASADGGRPGDDAVLAGGGASAETLQEETECQRQVLENLLAWPGSWPAPPLLDERGG